MARTLTRRHVVMLVAGTAAYVAFVMNASYINDRFIHPFEFGEPEMVEALMSLNRTAEWQFTWSEAGYRVQGRFERKVGEDVIRSALESPLAGVAHACGSRTFMQAASACYDTTKLPVIGDVTVARQQLGSAEVVRDWRGVTGELVALGRKLDLVELRLALPDGIVTLRRRHTKTFKLLTLHIGERVKPIVNYYNPAAE